MLFLLKYSITINILHNVILKAYVPGHLYSKRKKNIQYIFWISEFQMKDKKDNIKNTN
jgi:hypothetical protein